MQSVCDSCQQTNWKQLIDANYYVFIGAELPIADKEKILRYARSTKKQIFFVPTLYELACKNTGFLLVDDIPMQRVTRMRPSFPSIPESFLTTNTWVFAI